MARPEERRCAQTEVDGVRLQLENAEQVRYAFRAIRSSVGGKAGPESFSGVTVQPMVRRDGYELIVGSSIDEQFGPVILFGSGGVMVEVYRDRALALPPLNTTLAQRLIEQTRIYTALKGVRGRKSVDLAKLEQLLVRFSRLVIEQPWIKEIEINPLLATPDHLIALDARVLLHDPKLSAARLPRPAIRFPNCFRSFVYLMACSRAPAARPSIWAPMPIRPSLSVSIATL